MPRDEAFFVTAAQLATSELDAPQIEATYGGTMARVVVRIRALPEWERRHPTAETAHKAYDQIKGRHARKERERRRRIRYQRRLDEP